MFPVAVPDEDERLEDHYQQLHQNHLYLEGPSQTRVHPVVAVIVLRQDLSHQLLAEEDLGRQ